MIKSLGIENQHIRQHILFPFPRPPPISQAPQPPPQSDPPELTLTEEATCTAADRILNSNRAL